MSLRLLRTAALAELASLILLLANLATVHWAPVAALLGPVHGGAYLLVIGATVQVTGDLRSRLTAVVPGVGGLLVLRRLRRRPGPGREDGDVSMSATGR
ncbi:DUF3817 domain-containing protein [Actinoplanes sp. ATCC 53533]|uniref:DUF3817 domain-containing protein n=1 Tax=Actinoplanes sp. ATCC 53533 TaxID=1288362 RepID=UPI000F797EDB|nr:DUF3817 domain-containing protein [Actinoplanes sp. ATCC 53533]RSM56654.1 DUF3817 domain-containing protein [Actinoplanes sp. ATCC 53533]